MALANCTYSLILTAACAHKEGTQRFSSAFTSAHGLWLNHRGKMLIKLHLTHLPWFWFTGLLANFTGRHNHCEKSLRRVMRNVWPPLGQTFPKPDDMCHQACLDPHHFHIISPNPLS